MNSELIRGAGILLPISALSTEYGIGTFGREAYEFVDALKEAGQKYWQVLPLNQIGKGNSPYQSVSAFAGNPFYIDLSWFIEKDYLSSAELKEIDWGIKDSEVDYEKIIENRINLIKVAYKKWSENIPNDYVEFEKKEDFWLKDYALFMALKEEFLDASWNIWEEDIRYRKKDAILKYNELLKENILFWKFTQYIFFMQWQKLKDYANSMGVKIIGDIPIYVSYDSSDVWSDPQSYLLDEDLNPIVVAGCPPDNFAKDGQHWGNPIYNYSRMEKNKFSWWEKRIKKASKLYDLIRIDHFIGLVRYYCIPFGKKPKDGYYQYGPGRALTKVINKAVKRENIIAEDLGVSYEGVAELLEKEQYKNMKVLMFAFDGRAENDHLTYNYNKNQVVYLGTHDNDTFKGYLKKAGKKERELIKAYTGSERDADIVKNLIKTAYLSVADICIVQMQDVLEKGSKSRMNTPATVGENWKWRMKKDEFNKEDREFLKKLAEISGR